MEKFVRMAVLADVYGRLLTDNQRKVVDLHYEEDLSLGEIAEQFGISRAAVHDTLRRAQASLEAYEETLGVVAADIERKRLLGEALVLLDEASGAAASDWGADTIRAVDRVRSIIRRLLGEPGHRLNGPGEQACGRGP